MTVSPQRSKPAEGRTCSGFFGRSRFASAPIMIGSTVSADTTTAPTPIAAAIPSLPISGMPITSRPAIATITTTPAATTEAPEVAAAFADASRAAVAGGDLLAVSPDDQQRVVDAGAEPEHDRDHGRELRQGERLGEGDQQDLADHHAEQRADERRRHRGERAEQQRQQDDRHADADQLADRRVLLGGRGRSGRRAPTTCTPSRSAVSAAFSSATPSAFSRSCGSVE